MRNIKLSKWSKNSIIVIVILFSSMFYQYREWTTRMGDLDIVTLVAIGSTFSSITSDYESNVLTSEKLDIYYSQLATMEKYCRYSDNLRELFYPLYQIQDIEYAEIDEDIISKYTVIVEKLSGFNKLVYSKDMKEHGRRAYKLLHDDKVRSEIIEGFSFIKNPTIEPIR